VRSVLDRLRERDAYGDADLARITASTAIIWGERDGLFPYTTAQRMAAALPRAHLYRLAGCGHAVHWECPRALADALDEFRQTAGATPRPPGPVLAVPPAPGGDEPARRNT
jgi:pimeloyl-ACP methyl ester carboxylesterase